MTTSGLGKSDIERRDMIGGIFKEFVAGVLEHYVKTYGAEHENTKLCQDGYYAEPHVAEKVFDAMLAGYDWSLTRVLRRPRATGGSRRARPHRLLVFPTPSRIIAGVGGWREPQKPVVFRPKTTDFDGRRVEGQPGKAGRSIAA
jgi:hypothetical protein